MKDKFPDGLSLLIMAAIHNQRRSNVVEISATILDTVGDTVPAPTLFAYLDTLVQRAMVIRIKAPGRSDADPFELTDKGEKRLLQFADGIKLLVPCDPDEHEGEAA